MYSDWECLIAIFRADDWPPFSLRSRVMACCAVRRPTLDGPSSVDPSSTTMISSAGLVCLRTLWIASSMKSLPLYSGITAAIVICIYEPTERKLSLRKRQLTLAGRTSFSQRGATGASASRDSNQQSASPMTRAALQTLQSNVLDGGASHKTRIQPKREFLPSRRSFWG
jgi:hypothetical protein